MTAPQEPGRDHEQDDDAVFRQIVAGFADATSDPVPRWPVSEDVDGDREPSVVPRDPGPRDTTPVPEEELPGWLEPAALQDEGHFVPPPPPRLPRLRLRTVGGVALMLVGFAALFVPFRVGLDDTPSSLVLGMLLVAAGLAVLIGSMRDAPGPDDRPDGGAVV
ncbi:MAG TPA: hypothetical protein VM097_07765 [Mycobacteriales bacterium]|nr:hypothetical protein [Mycobacteriales bacterium]